MKNILCTAVAVTLTLFVTQALAAKRQHVVIQKEAPSQQPATVPLRVIVPIAVAFDLARRTSCDPAVAVGTGPGDPGFDLVNGPKVGNFLVPAIYRSQCIPVPTPQGKKRTR